MNIIQLFEDFSIPYVTEGNKHTSQGWANIHCPFCEGSQNYHLGFNLSGNYFTCYRCGWHSINDTIIALLNINWQQAKEIINQYGGHTYIKHIEKLSHQNTKPHKLPSNTMPLQKTHKKYLEKRGFDPDFLEQEWKLVGTGPVSTLKKDDYMLDFRFRIIIPYIWSGKQISFDARDITGKTSVKYMACPLEREIIPHKSILYGKQESWGTTGICVEGTTDVWRLGRYAFATSGIAYTPKQVNLIAKTFKRVAVLFDEGEEKEKGFFDLKTIKKNLALSKEIQSKQQAKSLIAELRFRGIDAFKVSIKGDPASLSQSEADYLVKQLIS